MGFAWKYFLFNVIVIVLGLNIKAIDVPVLEDGVFTAGAVDAGDFMYYEMPLPAGFSKAIKVALQPIFGDPDMFLTLNGSIPGIETYEYSSKQWWTSSEQILIRPEDDSVQKSCLASECVLKLGIFGKEKTEYMVTVTSEGTPIQLLSGSAYSGVAMPNLPALFQFNLNYGGNFTLMSFSGSPVLYLGCGSSFPSSMAYVWKLNLEANTGGMLSISESEAIKSGCQISDKTLTIYSIIESENNGTAAFRLVTENFQDDGIENLVEPGMPLSGTAWHHQFKYYEIRLGDNRYNPIALSVMSEEGTVEFYVGKNNSKPFWDDASNSVANYNALYTNNVTEGSASVIRFDSTFFHEICHLIDEECVFRFGVMGAEPRETGNRFVLTVMMQNVATLLMEGVPIRASNTARQIRYFRMTVVEPNADLSISVTPLAGDPDIYVGAPGDDPPTALRYRWESVHFGGDSLVIQAKTLAEFCNPLIEACDFMIGISSWISSSYTVQSSMSRGWQKPLSLVYGQPQMGIVEDGGFAYYQIAVGSNVTENPHISVTVTPTDGGDTDIFITSSREREPGPDMFDIRSQSWTGSDVAIFTEGVQHYCTNCTLFIAVRGFRGGRFSITAELNRGITLLQAGLPVTGSIENGNAKYYYLHTPEGSSGNIEIRLTVLNGDTNLYVTAGFGTELPGPGRSDFQWTSEKSGDDAVQVYPTDANYCTDCAYVIGVYLAGGEVGNATFTLEGAIGGADVGVITLVHGRPQKGRIQPSSSRCYTVNLISDSERLELTLTTLTGGADMFLANTLEVDKSKEMPNPGNPNSYNATTRGQIGSQSGAIVVEGGNDGNAVSYVVCIWSGAQDTEYSIVAGFSQTAIILQTGIPQRHFVSNGAPELFQYWVGSDQEDVQITVTAISGDPDVFVGSNSLVPLCIKESEGYTCENWIWASADSNLDTIQIDHSNPCLVPPQTQHVIVSPECRSDSFGIGPLNINVYGYVDSQFNIVVTPVGRIISLTGGMVQHGSTSVVMFCKERNPTGSCTPGLPTTLTQAANYLFEVNEGAKGLGQDTSVFINVRPECNATVPLCDPLNVYIKSCRADVCQGTDMYPSQYHSDIQTTVDASNYPTQFIARDPLNPSNGHCIPRPGPSGTCRYYISIFSGSNELATPGIFSIDASSSDSVSVLPCRQTVKGDGILDAGSGEIGTPDNSAGPGKAASKHYEGCATAKKGGYRLSMEVCTGDNLELLLLDGTFHGQFPTSDNYQYKATFNETCTTDSKGLHHCSVKKDDIIPSIDVIGPASEAFYVSVYGIGSYKLRREELSDDGKSVAPIMLPAIQSDGLVLRIHSVSDSAVTASWVNSFITFGSNKRDCTGRCTFIVYIIDETVQNYSQNFVLSTPCGLEVAAEKMPEFLIVHEFSEYIETESRVQFLNLKPASEYRIEIVARCDFLCMSALFPAQCSSALCNTQTYVYPSTRVLTKSTNRTSSSYENFFIKVTLAAIVTVVFIGAIVIRSNDKHRKKLQMRFSNQLEFVDRRRARVLNMEEPLMKDYLEAHEDDVHFV